MVPFSPQTKPWNTQIYLPLFPRGVASCRHLGLVLESRSRRARQSGSKQCYPLFSTSSRKWGNGMCKPPRGSCLGELLMRIYWVTPHTPTEKRIFYSYSKLKATWEEKLEMAQNKAASTGFFFLSEPSKLIYNKEIHIDCNCFFPCLILALVTLRHGISTLCDYLLAVHSPCTQLLSFIHY